MPSNKVYDHSAIEKKWQKKWLHSKIYSPNLDLAKRPFYNLFMFPYPSAEGLHAGHAMSSTGSDIYGRFIRMTGKDVFQPMGYDSFGIHSENYALKIGESPQEMLKHSIKHFQEQFESFGHGYDWSHTVNTSDIEYYRWTEWIFLEIFKAGLAYRKKAKVNFCPKDKTVLSDEQVMTPKQAGKDPIDARGNKVEDREGLMVCERCGCVIEKKELEVWFFRITDYAERLLNNLEKIDWSEGVKVTQKEWIGKSKGMLVKFKKENGEGEIEVFTTRPDTLSSATFLVLADEELYNKHKEDKDKFGEFTGEYVINPATNSKMPIWRASYVAPGYGTGAVMGVPAYDDRDKAFAKKYGLEVIKNKLGKKPQGKLHVNYHLRDWGIGRQRYWGCPIPMIYCVECANKGRGWIGSNTNKLIHKHQIDWDWQGWWPEENLPVKLPVITDYKPEGNGRGPLANHPEFYEVKCPHCGSKARRETDVADTFLDSSWYFFRYPSTDDITRPWNPDRTKKWLPVSLYFGGAEHAVLHLMYSRFVTMVFKDLKLISFEEPFPKFFAHGLMIKDGAKMSKSMGNVVNPDEYIKKFGADTLRMYLVFIGPMDGSPDFRDSGIEGMYRFVKRIWVLYQENKESGDKNKLNSVMHQTIQKVTKDIEIFHYNTTISAIMEFVNFLKDEGTTKEALEVLCKLLAPFAPHIAEELWVEVLGNKFSVHLSNWPQYDSKYFKVDKDIIIVQVDGKVRSTVVLSRSEFKGKNKQSLSFKKKIKNLALADEKLQKWISNGKSKQHFKTIFVPGKIINFVTASGRGSSNTRPSIKKRTKS